MFLITVYYLDAIKPTLKHQSKKFGKALSDYRLNITIFQIGKNMPHDKIKLNRHIHILQKC